ncbi:hypothetical protein QBA35_35425 [Streptomyces bottropensis]|uniref:Uncharacterized protein n=1 Tax=Streptomyces bottropensis TaxID=42235 RepID=A0ABU8AY33_9ACTN
MGNPPVRRTTPVRLVARVGARARAAYTVAGATAARATPTTPPSAGVAAVKAGQSSSD